MKVLVTGAAGNLGSAVCRVLARDGVEVVATDLRTRADLPFPVHAANLLDRAAMDRLARGVDAAVHLGNHIDFAPPDPQMIFGENATMNVNVFQAAIDGGARKLVFASSIQAMSSVPQLPREDLAEMPAYLPLDGDSPAAPTNPYALSKQAGEIMLQYYSRVFGAETVAVRWPALFAAAKLPVWGDDWRQKAPWIRRIGFGYLSFEDAAELTAAILRSPLPGNRVYQPASYHNMLGRPVQELLDSCYRGVPIRKPFAPGAESLFDITRIERETGWKPRD